MKTKRVEIKGEWYTITQVTDGTYYILKDGASPPGYLVKLPSSCACKSYKRPCKHIRPVLDFSNEIHYPKHARSEMSRRFKS
jgi:hypothetical protein